MPPLNPGQHAPLNVTQEASHRIYAGLGWDPKDASESGVLEAAKSLISGKKSHHDLDLACLLYDENGVLLETVNATNEHNVNATGSVYHSGDNEEGIGEGDDEQISVELKKLDRLVHHIIFKVHIKSGHHFGEIDSPEIHVSDGYSNHRFLHASLNDKATKGKTTFLFVHIYRNGENWTIHNINEFLDSTADAHKAIEKQLKLGYYQSIA